MVDDAARNDDLDRLHKREAELLDRIERLKTSMNQTGEIDTLFFCISNDILGRDVIIPSMIIFFHVFSICYLVLCVKKEVW